jgi:signal transduction histidine kinase
MRRRSLARDLPIAIGVLLAVTVTGLALAAYQEVRQSTLDASRDRLERATLQLSDLLAQSVRNRFAVIESTAALPPVRDVVRGGRPVAPPPPLVQLARAPLVTSLELWDAGGRRLAHTHDVPPLDTAQRRDVLESLREGRSGIGRFHRIGDTVVYALITTLTDGRQTGYLVERRRLSNTPAANRQLAELIGDSARLVIGNAGGDVWTDFSQLVQGPPTEALTPGAHEYERAGARVLARSARIAGTPWEVVVEFPRALVTTRAQTFLVRIILIALGVWAIGVAGAWALARWITRPLAHVTEAAEAIAAGRSAPPLAAGRRDEIGRLTDAFTTMAEQVERSHARLETQVRERTAALQDSLQELEAFSYTVSHDLRAPLRAMQGFAQALLEDYSPSLDETGRDYATRVVDASRRMDDLIQDLLAYSRLSREQLSISTVDLDVVVAEVLLGFQDEIERMGGRVEVASPLGRVTANGRILQQILANLVGNALKFVPAGTAPGVRIATEQRNGRRRLWVEDNGIGIAPEHRERIFRVFERLHSGDTYPGTGIGLAIVRRGAERMSGEVGVDSTPGRGSRFWVELPIENGA